MEGLVESGKKVKMQVEMIVASTLDGFIAQETGQSSLDWTSRADKIFFTKKSKEAKFIVLGENTFRTLDLSKITKGRVIIVLTSRPDGVAETNLDWAEVNGATEKGIVAVKMTVTELVTALEERGVAKLLVCGGVNVYRQFWQSGLVKRLYLTLEPIFFGQGLSLGVAVGMGNGLQRLRVESWEKLPESETMVVTLRNDD